MYPRIYLSLAVYQCILGYICPCIPLSELPRLQPSLATPRGRHATRQLAGSIGPIWSLGCYDYTRPATFTTLLHQAPTIKLQWIWSEIMHLSRNLGIAYHFGTSLQHLPLFRHVKLRDSCKNLVDCGNLSLSQKHTNTHKDNEDNFPKNGMGFVLIWRIK